MLFQNDKTSYGLKALMLISETRSVHKEALLTYQAIRRAKTDRLLVMKIQCAGSGISRA